MSRQSRFRLGLLLWCLAMSGVLVLTFTLIPGLLGEVKSPLPAWAILAISATQSAVLVAAAVWAGVGLARPLGLGAPALEAAVAGGGFWKALAPRLAPAGAIGLVVAAILVVLQQVTPGELALAASRVEIPLAAKLLYGGITEEVLMRWGVLTLAAWIFWRLVGKRGTALRPSIMLAIVLSALLFGLGHLPAARAMGAALSTPVVAYIVLGNALPGLLFGGLYWRCGLEAAMLAHALAHLLFHLAS
jgi:hypothetical protein